MGCHGVKGWGGLEGKRMKQCSRSPSTRHLISFLLRVLSYLWETCPDRGILFVSKMEGEGKFWGLTRLPILRASEKYLCFTG